MAAAKSPIEIDIDGQAKQRLLASLANFIGRQLAKWRQAKMAKLAGIA